MKAILQNNDRTEVYSFGCDEFFINDKINKTTIRVSCGGYGMTITSNGNYILPTSVNGLSAVMIKAPC